jgi:hypothetical protein
MMVDISVKETLMMFCSMYLCSECYSNLPCYHLSFFPKQQAYMDCFKAVLNEAQEYNVMLRYNVAGT